MGNMKIKDVCNELRKTIAKRLTGGVGDASANTALHNRLMHIERDIATVDGYRQREKGNYELNKLLDKIFNDLDAVGREIEKLYL